jgi:hypothetical protein
LDWVFVALGTDEVMFGVDLNWPRDYFMADLESVLDREFPGWKPANQVEDFNGQTMHVVTKAIAFPTSEDLLRFLLQYSVEYSATPTKNLRFDIEPF